MSHRSEFLDNCLGKRVNVIFKSGKNKEGVLHWQGDYDSNIGLIPYMYHIRIDDGTYYGFRKSHIKKVEVL